MNIVTHGNVLAMAVACSFLTSCFLGESDSTAGHAEAKEGHAHGEAEAHGEHEASDLDRPVSELFSDTCEHDIKTYECEECRYEVGVVRASENLFEGGLLDKGVVQKHTVAVPLTFTGEIRFDDRLIAHVSTQSEGRITGVHVTIGDRVKERQALVEIESVSLGEAQAEYLESRAMLKLAKRNHERLAELRKDGISSEKELLEAKKELDIAQIRVDATFGKLTRLGMSASEVRSLNRTRANGRVILRSPSDGVVLDLHAVPGEIVDTETSMGLIGDNSALWVWADLYEADIDLVTREQAKQPLDATIEVKAFPGEEFAGVVDFISPSMSESSRTVKARVAVPNPDGRLLAGMFALVKILIQGGQQVLAVPSKSVLEDDGRTFVFIHHEQDYYVRRPVTTGRSSASMTEITKGLSGGEVIVTNGAFLLKSDVLRSKMGAGCAD